MQDHVDDSCALTLLPCSFRYIGCNEKVVMTGMYTFGSIVISSDWAINANLS